MYNMMMELNQDLGQWWIQRNRQRQKHKVHIKQTKNLKQNAELKFKQLASSEVKQSIFETNKNTSGLLKFSECVKSSQWNIALDVCMFVSFRFKQLFNEARNVDYFLAG